MSVNDQLAARFERMAQMLELLGESRFKVIAYQRGTRAIENMTDDLASMVDPEKPNDLKALTRLDGIGKGLAEKIVEFVTTGRIEEYDQLEKQLPPGLMALLDIPGLGPKTIALLWREADVTSLDDLKKKLKGDSLADLPGLGEKKLENLRKSIEFAGHAADRTRIGQALPLARWLIDQLRKLDEVKRIDLAGSIRRGRETIGDVDLLVAADEADRPAIAQAYTGLDLVTDVLVKGPTKSSVRTEQGMQVDLRVVDPKHYGAALLYFTGSKEHNVALRQRAVDRGMSLNEYALTKGDQTIASETEKDIYQALDLAWIEPELRENRGEIKLAEKNKLPTLITVKDIKAELHAHTTASDGKLSIEQLVAAAVERGFHTIAVTDHSRGQAQAHGLSIERLEKHVEEVHRVAEKVKDKITVLAGSEVDILADGALDYPSSVLKTLDIVVASPHNALTQDPGKATARLIKAISNRYVNIIGHPTGRLIGRREGLAPDMSKVIAAAKDHGVALEINANHWRLDLRDTHARAALEAGVMLAINTDAHGSADFDQLYYGILTARRAGATKERVVNCLSSAKLGQWLTARR